MPGTAIFDLDRTLTRRPTWLRFVYSMNGRRPGFWLQLPGLLVSALAFRLGLMDRTAIKNRLLRTLSWAGRERIEEAGQVFAEMEVRHGLRRGADSLVRQHKTQGDHLVLATAANDFIAGPIARLLEFDSVVCTRTHFPAGPGGAPAVDGLNCYGTEKLRRITDAHERFPFPVPVRVYSDHVSDAGLLSWADEPVAVNPSPALRRLAQRTGMKIIDLDRDATGPEEIMKE